MEKNFDELQVGEWYQARGGEITQIKRSEKDYFVALGSDRYSRDGNYGIDSNSIHDLIIHIEPLHIIPKKRKVKRKIERWITVYASNPRNLSLSHYNSELEAKNEALDNMVSQQICLTGEYEIEE